MNATTTRAREMSDSERRERHARSMALYDLSIRLSMAGTVSGIIGIALWPAIVVSFSLLGAALLVSWWAEAVSPYGGKA